jgi:uncharacterized protein (TIGR03083 family)
MSREGIEGMRAAGDDLLGVAAQLTEDQWRAPSAAAGWSVQDVFIHVGSLLELLQAAVAGAESPPLGIEKLNDEMVAQRRDWTRTQTVQFLRHQLGAALTTFTALQDEPVASTAVPMLDLGSYPLHSIADMFSFDITTHLHYDILATRGPIRLPVPPLDEVRLAPSVAWLLGGITQMQPDLADHLLAPIGLRLTGPGARNVVLTPGSGAAVEVSDRDDTTTAVVATVTSTTEHFLAWSTQRLPWSGLVSVDGTRDVAEHFLNALNLI